MIPAAWLLGWAPLWNSVRAVVYTRRGPDRPRRLPPAKFVAKALVVVGVVVVAPVALAPTVRSALLAAGSTPTALAALSWTLVCGLSLLFGFLAALGMSLPAALAMDHLVLSLPLPRSTHIAARLVSLQLEGLFWTLLLAYPLVLHSLAVQEAGLIVHVTGVAAGALACVALVSLGVALAHALFAVLPRTSRTRLLVNTLLVTVVGVGLGIVATFARSARGRALDAALMLNTSPLSPTWLPQQILYALGENAPARAAAYAAALALVAAATSGAALAAMRVSHERICFLEEA
jgi:hypothetical protein